METLYATSVIMTLSLAVFVSVQVKQRPLSGYRSLEEGSDQFANDDIMELLYIKPKYRPIFLVSLVTGAAGLALLMLGISPLALNSETARTDAKSAGSLTFTALCISIIVPLVATIVSNINRKKGGKQSNLTAEGIFFVASIILLVLINRNNSASISAQQLVKTKIHLTSLYNILGAILFGVSMGVFKRIATARIPASSKLVASYLFYLGLLLMFFAPLFEYPHLRYQLRHHDTQNLYYKDRKEVFLFFLVNGLLLSLTLFSIMNLW